MVSPLLSPEVLLHNPHSTGWIMRDEGAIIRTLLFCFFAGSFLSGCTVSTLSSENKHTPKKVADYTRLRVLAGKCYRKNIAVLGRHPRFLDVSWCRNLKNFPTSLHAGHKTPGPDWEGLLDANSVPPLYQYECTVKTVSNFGSEPPWHHVKRCRKIR